MSERTPCCIPGCKRTFRADQMKDSSEAMCGRHYRTIDDRLIQRHKQMFKRMRKIDRLIMRKAIQNRVVRRNTMDATEARFHRIASKVWAACKLDATIKAAMGAEATPRKRRAA